MAGCVSACLLIAATGYAGPLVTPSTNEFFVIFVVSWLEIFVAFPSS